MGRMGNEGNAMNKDLVSIIMLAHGRMQFVEESVRSVLAQTYSRWELLCVDDSPGYEVVRLLQDLKGNDSRIHVYQSVVQEGACNDRNSALKDAHGRWIAFLDCGDVWEPEKLERQVAFMEEHGYAFSYTAYLRRGKRIVSGLPVVGWDELLRYCWINYLTMMYDCQQLGKVYTKGVCHLKDAYELMLEISKGANCYLLPECLAKSRKLGRPGIFTKLLWHYRVLCYAKHVNSLVALWRNLQYLWYAGIKRIKYSQKV